MRGLLVVERVGAAFGERSDVVDNEFTGVEVWQRVVDVVAADSAGWATAANECAVLVASGRVPGGHDGSGVSIRRRCR